MPKTKQARSEKQQQQTQEFKASCPAVGKSEAEKQAVQDALHPYKKTILNLVNFDTTKLQNITKGV